MMTNRSFFFAICMFITFLLTSSCNHQQGEKAPENTFQYSIDLLNNMSFPSKNFDDLFIWEEIIPLKFDDETVLGEISKVIKTNTNYYVFDRKTQSLFSFDLNGTCIKQFGDKGHGPGEYIHIDDFLVDNDNNELVLLGNEGRAGIYFYDLNTADFLRKLSINIFPLSFTKVNDSFLVYTSKNPSEEIMHDIFLISKTGEVLKRYMPYDIDIPVISIQSGFLKNSVNHTFYAPPYYEDIYKFDEQKMTFTPYMHAGINNKYIEENKNKPIKIFRSAAAMDESTSFLMSWFETNDINTLLTFHKNKEIGMIIYNHSRQDYSYIAAESLDHDLRYRILNIFNPHTLIEANNLIFSINPESIEKEKNNIHNFNSNSAYKKAAKNIHFDNNDIHHLAIIKVK